MSAVMTPPASGVKVRMYRQGLGDCFLLAFPGAGGEARYLLIDCGVILGTADAKDIMCAVAEDIRAATGGDKQTGKKGRLHVLVATHEHWDHLSGFLQAAPIFDAIDVDQLWLAWTEDPENELANALRGQRRKRVAQLRGAAARMQAAGGSASAAGVHALLEFFGAAGGQDTEAALRKLTERVESPRYCHPAKDPFALRDFPGVRFYVLGPPEDEKLIKKSDPTKKGKEVYEMAGVGLDFESAFLTAVALGARPEADFTPEEHESWERSLPFDRAYQVPEGEARNHPFFREHYFAPGAGGARRRIDGDWLEAAGQLALKLDSDTNNTSLVLAIELLPSRKVLLFPGDAQVGNWLSWEKCAWEVGDGGAKAKVTGHDLLRRTVLYKVGHHGSHNATLRDKGLELMTSDELVALIPVDEKMAREKKHWDMPFGSLFKRLKEKTRGRVLRADKGVKELKAAKKPGGLSAADWKDFKNRLGADADDELYVEYTVPG